MRIGFVGYGSMARALGSRWVADHAVSISGRSRQKAQALAEAIGASHCEPSELVQVADVIVLATRHEVAIDAIDLIGGADALAGKTLLDINNPVSHNRNDFLPRTYDGKSLSEVIADCAPQAHVVKAFNMCQATVWGMEPPVFDGRTLVTLYCGDDLGAKRQAATLIEDLGSAPFDLGELHYARLLEAAAAIVIKLLASGRDPHTVLNLIEPEVKPVA